MNITNLINKKDYLTIIEAIKDEDFTKIKQLKNNALINIKPNSSNHNDLTYINNIKNIFRRLEDMKKNYTLRIYINNRELLRQSNLLSNIPKNINLIICSNDYEYNLEEYLEEESKLEKIITPIRNSNLSPLEKYLAIYDIVKKFKPYKDNDENQQKSRNLKYILEDNNDYIVCVGFANLLKELLNRVNIPSTCIHVDVDSSYNGKYTQEEITINNLGHTRNLVKIDDNKYHIHGYYISDSTWDNNQKYDLYLNSLLTFDEKKEAKLLESLEDEDLLLDFHSVDEFIEKIKFYIKRKISHPNINSNSIEQLRKKSYKDLYLKIISILKQTDIKEYQELYNKYNNQININIEKLSSNDLEPVMTNFLTEYAKYIIPLSNNKINLETILRAVIKVKKEVYKMNTPEIKEWLEQTLKDNLEIKSKAFPYIYNSNNKTEAYLEDRNIKKR